MRVGASKQKSIAGRRPKPVPGGVLDPSKSPAAAPDRPRGPGSKLVHELGGTLAAIGLHLRMAAEHALPAVSAQHVDAALEAIRASRDQLTQLAEILAGLERPKP